MTQKTANRKATKIVTVLAIYVFTLVNRVCFTVLSSDGVTRYHTCFDHGHASCDCPAHGECYHIRQLREVAEARLAKRDAVQAAQAVVTAKFHDDEYEAWKRENGLTDRLSRDEYCSVFGIYK